MDRTVFIDGREVRLRASAAIPRLYRIKFRRDIIQDMSAIQRAIARERESVSESDTGEKTGGEAGEEGFSSLPLEALTLFENIAYLMARHADPQGVPDSVDSWMDGFETFSIYQVMPVIQEMWEENLRTLNEPKKK